jgi:hypothetical protein
MLAPLGDDDDARMVGRPARRSRGSPTVEAYTRNLRYPILLFANQEGNSGREFCANCSARGLFRFAAQRFD